MVNKMLMKIDGCQFDMKKAKRPKELIEKVCIKSFSLGSVSLLYFTFIFTHKFYDWFNALLFFFLFWEFQSKLQENVEVTK